MLGVMSVQLTVDLGSSPWRKRVKPTCGKSFFNQVKSVT